MTHGAKASPPGLGLVVEREKVMSVGKRSGCRHDALDEGSILQNYLYISSKWGEILIDPRREEQWCFIADSSDCSRARDIAPQGARRTRSTRRRLR